MEIEDITIIDFLKIETLGKESLPIYYSKNDLLVLIINKTILKKFIFNGEIIGFGICDLYENENRVHILSIAIKKEYRNRGFSTFFIDFLKNTFSFDITLYVQTVNEEALGFYKKNNFKIVKTLNNYYSNLSSKDAYFMKYDKST